MSEPELIQAELTAKFPFLQGCIQVPRARRVSVDVPAEHVAYVFTHLVTEAECVILCAITGLDLGATLGILYHLAREDGTLVTLATAVPKENPVIQTVTWRFPAADCYERELIDLLGIQVQGLPEGQRYPLPDNWPAGQYPLRKDWKPESLDALPAYAKEPDNE